MKSPFKVGDTVLTTKNPAWGKKPMIVIRLSDVANLCICRHPDFGSGGFKIDELKLAEPNLTTRNRLAKLKKLAELENQIEKLKKKLYKCS